MKTTKIETTKVLRNQEVGSGVKALYCQRMLYQLTNNMIKRGANAEEVAVFQKDFLEQNELSVPDSFFPDTDDIDVFLEECTLPGESNIKALDLYNSYLIWCKKNERLAKQKHQFYQVLKSEGLFAASATIDGKTIRNCVRNIKIKVV